MEERMEERMEKRMEKRMEDRMEERMMQLGKYKGDPRVEQSGGVVYLLHESQTFGR
jgi:hypothetical protein